MDERARRAIASECGLWVAGAAAIIGMAKQRGLIGSARDLFVRLHGSDSMNWGAFPRVRQHVSRGSRGRCF